MQQELQLIKSYYDKLISQKVRKYEAASRALTKGIYTFIHLVEKNNGRMPASKFTKMFDINNVIWLHLLGHRNGRIST